jgi:hypothetical protein
VSAPKSSRRVCAHAVSMRSSVARPDAIGGWYGLAPVSSR